MVLSSDQIERLRALIAAQIDQPLKLRDLTDAVGVSESHFVRAFKESLRVTPYRYLLREHYR